MQGELVIWYQIQLILYVCFFIKNNLHVPETQQPVLRGRRAGLLEETQELALWLP